MAKTTEIPVEVTVRHVHTKRSLDRFALICRVLVVLLLAVRGWTVDDPAASAICTVAALAFTYDILDRL